MNRRNYLRRLNNKQVSIYSDHRLIERGTLSYEESICSVNGVQIPICSMRSVASWDSGSSRALIFIDFKYGLENKVA